MKKPAIARGQFEAGYAGAEHVRELYDYGAFPAVRCDCGEEGCAGWRRRYEDDWPDGVYPKDREPEVVFRCGYHKKDRAPGYVPPPQGHSHQIDASSFDSTERRTIIA